MDYMGSCDFEMYEYCNIYKKFIIFERVNKYTYVSL